MQKEKVIIVHGEKPLRDGSMHPAFYERLRVAIQVAQEQGPCVVVVTGGKTRKRAVAEAEMGAEFLKKEINETVLIEDKSRTTIENINFTRLLLQSAGISFAQLFVIDSDKRMFRLKYLYRRLWPEARDAITFVAAPDTYPILFSVWEFISYLCDHIDIRERGILRLAKAMFR